MDLPALLDALTKPSAYPYHVEAIEVRQTHISAVFLAGDFVYKIKKPVAPGFLDFTILEKRRHYCEEEVRLNRRLAPEVYLGVVPIVATSSGLRFEAKGQAIEWAVKMRRLPEDATLLDYLERGEVTTSLLESLARRVAKFHKEADRSDSIAECGRFEIVSKNFLDLFERATPCIDRSLPRSIFERTRTRAQETLARLRPLIESRAARGVPCDGHGDLHLDHVYLFPERAAPGDLVIIDCIEFNPQFRFLDPIADMAFAVMDLAFHGRRDLARTFTNAYLLAANDEEGRLLVPLYTAYRAAVRGMVEGLLLSESEVPETDRLAAEDRSLAHWLLALGELESPERRPALVLIAGLPGAGKSVVAAAVAEAAGFVVVRSDVVRKERAGLSINAPTPPELRERLYSPEATDATYAECQRRAEQVLAEGGRVIVDANFREDRHRRVFIEAAVRLGAPVLLLRCVASEATIRERLTHRRGDASDADWTVFQKLSDRWEEPGDVVKRVLVTLTTEDTAGETRDHALNALWREGLL